MAGATVPFRSSSLQPGSTRPFRRHFLQDCAAALQLASWGNPRARSRHIVASQARGCSYLACPLAATKTSTRATAHARFMALQVVARWQGSQLVSVRTCGPVRYVAATRRGRAAAEIAAFPANRIIARHMHPSEKMRPEARVSAAFCAHALCMVAERLCAGARLLPNKLQIAH